MRPTVTSSRLGGLLALGLAAVISGCGGGGPAVATAEVRAGPDRRHRRMAAGAPSRRADIDGWPSTAPADVPAFPGHVDNMMVGRQNGNGYGVRIFFSGVTRTSSTPTLAHFDPPVTRSRASSTTARPTQRGSGRSGSGRARRVRRRSATKEPRRIKHERAGNFGRHGHVRPRRSDQRRERRNERLAVAGGLGGQGARSGRLQARLAQHPRRPTPPASGCTACMRRPIRLLATMSSTPTWPPSRQRASRSPRPAARSSFSLSNGGYEVAINPDQGGHMFITATKATSMSNGWPSDWIDRVPQPDGCTLGASRSPRARTASWWMRLPGRRSSQ